MPEGIPLPEAGKELQEHAEHGRVRHEVVAIVEAVLLSLVTIVAAWSGYAAAKWQTHSSVTLAKASTTRALANRAYEEALTLRTTDSAMFNAWFSAYLTGRRSAERVAERRFRPQFDVAFRAWLATHPFTNRAAPKGPTYMPQYKPTGARASRLLDAKAGSYFSEGQQAASTADEYIRVTVVLASVLFIVGISSHFHRREIRWGLVAVGSALLLFAAVELLGLPGLPP